MMAALEAGWHEARKAAIAQKLSHFSTYVSGLFLHFRRYSANHLGFNLKRERHWSGLIRFPSSGAGNCLPPLSTRQSTARRRRRTFSPTQQAHIERQPNERNADGAGTLPQCNGPPAQSHNFASAQAGEGRADIPGPKQ